MQAPRGRRVLHCSEVGMAAALMRLRLYGRPDPRPDRRACSNVSQTAASAHVEVWHTARRYRTGRMWPHIAWPHVAMVGSVYVFMGNTQQQGLWQYSSVWGTVEQWFAADIEAEDEIASKLRCFASVQIRNAAPRPLLRHVEHEGVP